MNKITEAIMRHMAPPPQPAVVPLKNTTLTAEWQEGPTTISGYAPRKLRLAFARLPLDSRQIA